MIIFIFFLPAMLGCKNDFWLAGYKKQIIGGIWPFSCEFADPSAAGLLQVLNPF